MTDICKWKRESEDCEVFVTQCGKDFIVNDSVSGLEGWAKYCCFCGKKLAVEEE